MLLDLTMDEISSIGESLISGAVETIQPATGGGNNRVFRLDRGGESFALKFYPPQDDDCRDRLGVEWRALSFMIDGGMDAVPRPLAKDTERHCALFEWIDGGHVEEAAESDVEELAEFLKTLQGLRENDGAENIGPASAACFTPADTMEQLQNRLNRLREVAADFPELKRFLGEEFSPMVQSITDQAQDILADSKISPSLGRKVLSPSDFGLHNALKRPDGRLVFLDFEYFGWDSPEKTLCDVMLHPGVSLPESLGRIFFERMKPVLAAGDAGFDKRFKTIYPLYALIWCLILLNEFLPERWKRRDLGQRQNNRESVHAHQLSLAKQRLQILRKKP